MRNEGASVVRHEAFGKAEEFGACIGAPFHPAIFKDFQNDAVKGALQGADPVAGVERNGLAETFESGDHHFPIQSSCNVVSDGGGAFFEPGQRHVGKNGIGQGASDFGKSISVEEEKRSPPVAGSEQVKRRRERQFLLAGFFPLRRNRSVSFRVNSRLRTPSLAESAVDRGDRCPTPVFEKVGSAL